MYEEMMGMTNEEMFKAIIGRMDSMESGLNGRMDNLESKIGNLESRMDSLESNMDLEFRAVRTEMDVVYKTLKKDISALDNKMDRLMYTKDVEGHEKMKMQVELLTKGYQELKEKIGQGKIKIKVYGLTGERSISENGIAP